MSKFIKIITSIKDLYIIESTFFGDERGYFMESYNKKEFVDIGITKEFVQDNHSKSKKGVLRGLHFQIKFPQDKLIGVTKGAVYDVVVDLRKGSPTFRKYYQTKLTEKDNKMLFIPEGFAHGFLTLTDEAKVIYKVTEYYYAEYDRGIIWNDPNIMIQWPFKEYGIETPILSEKDKNLPRLDEIEVPFNYSREN